MFFTSTILNQDFTTIVGTDRETVLIPLCLVLEIIHHLDPRENCGHKMALKRTTVLPQDQRQIQHWKDRTGQGQGGTTMSLYASSDGPRRMKGYRVDPKSLFELLDSNGASLGGWRPGLGSWIWTSLKE